MRLFDYYSEIGALYAGICVVMGTTAMAQHLYSFVESWHIPSLLNAFSSWYWISLTSILGNSMQEQILKGREEVRNTLASERSQINTDLIETAKWMCNWEWKLAPYNLFVVNNHMIIAACGTALTQIIFLFQLKMSEVTTCGVNRTSPCECPPLTCFNPPPH
ncbi:unnamed protein product [Allacma fusca]|uniref:Uncharacterized protein n=1 Tax=Allacma fusca TaxID=39272 RepID=A0A8J2P3J4_9HEXA|nr:unnamed protein product [Allacma fusca]